MATTKRSGPTKARSKAVHHKRARAVPQDAEILNAHEAAVVLGIYERLVLKLARQGTIPATKLGREWRFLRSALRNHVAGEGGGDDVLKALTKAGVRFTVGRK